MSSVYLQNRVPSNDTHGDVTVTSVINRLSPISLNKMPEAVMWWNANMRVNSIWFDMSPTTTIPQTLSENPRPSGALICS